MADSPAQTIIFSEGSNTFESFISLFPENMCTVGNLLISFEGGDLYTHDSDVYNRFFGVDYPSSITPIFNQNSAESKSYVAIDERASEVWECPEIETSLMSYENVPQQSNLIESDFTLEEGKWHTSFLQDANSIGGLNNGDDLKGFWTSIKFQVTDASNLLSLNQILLHYIDSPLNK